MKLKNNENVFVITSLRPKNSKKAFSRSYFSDNSLQAFSSMHSDVQLLYLSFLAVVFIAY